MANKKMTAPKLKKLLAENGVHADKVGVLKTGDMAGCFQIKRGFFYRNKMTSQKWAADVEFALAKLGLGLTVVGNFEDWKTWPGDSYFIAYVRQVRICDTCKNAGEFIDDECMSCHDERMQFSNDVYEETE